MKIQKLINCNVLICPDCGGTLYMDQDCNYFACVDCKCRYDVVGIGQTDKELLCERTYQKSNVRTEPAALRCLRCGKRLKDTQSRERGYGKICWNKIQRKNTKKLF